MSKLTGKRAPQFFTPIYQGLRVRIPVSCVNRHTPRRATVTPGHYAIIDNGEAVTPSTPTLFLSGEFTEHRRACGLGCRCDAEITSNERTR